MAEPAQYEHNLHLIRSLLISTSLQKRKDVKALELINDFAGEVDWEPLSHLMIDSEVWDYVSARGYDPKHVFCHPAVLERSPATSLYYRGLAALPIKTAKAYVGSVEAMEVGNRRARLSYEKALKMARTYNTFICSNIKGSASWTLDNGYRTIIATLGITLDGVMRNRIGEIAERRVRALILEWLIAEGLLVTPMFEGEPDFDTEQLPSHVTLQNDITMDFGAEPDISFRRANEMLAVIEIKGGTDPAGALERYGAATKSFQHAVNISPRCRNFYLVAVYTDELQRRINEDRLVERTFHIVRILDDAQVRTDFIREVFHHTLRLI